MKIGPYDLRSPFARRMDPVSVGRGYLPKLVLVIGWLSLEILLNPLRS